MAIQPLQSETHYNQAVAGQRPALVFKHSPTCGLSDLAMGVVARFADDHPEIPVLVVDVLGQRDLSEAIAERLGIRHESPQSIVVRGGSAVWSASHRRITSDALANGVASAEAHRLPEPEGAA